MEWNHRQCEAFLAVVETGSFEAAAQRLHLTASAISQRVQAMEEQVGKPLLIRARPCRASRDGQRLLQHLQRVALLEADLASEFSEGEAGLLTVPLAVNADSVASWFLPALAQFLIAQRVLLDVIVDDQDHTYSLLQAGQAVGCVSTEAVPMRGCVAQPLGTMRYRCMASPEFKARWFSVGVSRDALRQAPVMVFNRKDRLQADFMLQHFGLGADAYPCHYLPASEAYMQAIRLGLGWGMLPEVQMQAIWATGELVDICPQQPTDVGLYWHCWKVQSPRLAALSACLVQAAQAILIPQASF